MTKRNKEDDNLDEDLSNIDENILDKKNETRPSRNTRKTMKYLELDEDINIDDFESDISDEFDLIEELSNEDCDLVLDDEDVELISKNKKSIKKKEDNNSKIKCKKSPKKNDEILIDEIDSDDDEKKLKPLKKKKLAAPKNLSKRNIVNTGLPNNIGETIYNYMKEQNRPYSIQNVVDNLHNTFTKKQVIDEMDRLTLEGKLTCKEYGKQKVYLIDQSDCKELNKDEMDALDKNILNFELELNNLEIRLKQLKQETRNISVPLPIEVLQEKINEEEFKVCLIYFFVTYIRF